MPEVSGMAYVRSIATADHPRSNASDKSICLSRARNVDSFKPYKEAHSRRVRRFPLYSNPQRPQLVVCPERRWSRRTFLLWPHLHSHRKQRLLFSDSTSQITDRSPNVAPGVISIRRMTQLSLSVEKPHHLPPQTSTKCGPNTFLFSTTINNYPSNVLTRPYE